MNYNQTSKIIRIRDIYQFLHTFSSIYIHQWLFSFKRNLWLMNWSIIHNYNRAWTWKRIAMRKNLIFDEFFEEFIYIRFLFKISYNKIIDNIYKKDWSSFESCKRYIFMQNDLNWCLFILLIYWIFIIYQFINKK